MTKEEFELILNDLTEAKDELNRLTLELQSVRGRAYLAVKARPGAYGLEKATENAIEAVLNTSAEVLEMELRVVSAKRRQGECFARYDLAKYEVDSVKAGIG